MSAVSIQTRLLGAGVSNNQAENNRGEFLLFSRLKKSVDIRLKLWYK